MLPVPGLLREFGVEPAGLLATVGLQEKQFDDPENRIIFDAMGHLLQACVVATQCPHFGLLIGQRFSPTWLGINFYLMRNAFTLREALQSFELHHHLHERGAVLYVAAQSAKEVTFGYGVHHSGGFDSVPVYEAALAIGVAIFRSICGLDWQPVRVTFTHDRPADVAPYKRCFRVPVQFNAAHAAIVFSTRTLDEPIKDRDPVLHSLLLQLVTRREASQQRSFVESVRRALRSMVVSGSVSGDQVVRLFARNRRALHRQLQVEGTNLRTLLNEARCEVARQFLKESNKSIGDIAALLNYADATAFSRAFHGWAGMSPRAWRSRQNGGRKATRRSRLPA